MFQFLNLFTQTVGLLGRVISPSQGLYLYTGQHKHRKTHKHINILASVGFEPTITASERAKTVHALDRSATVTGMSLPYRYTIRIVCQVMTINR
jgi:FAD synthase